MAVAQASDQQPVRILCGYVSSGGRAQRGVSPGQGAYIQQILKPLHDKAEPVYVLAGSKAESAAKRNPRKQVKIV